MVVLSLSLLLIPYAVVVVVFLVLALMNVFHLVRYGATTRTSFLFTSVFIVGTAVIAVLTSLALGNVDWSRQLTFDLMNAVPSAKGEFGI